MRTTPKNLAEAIARADQRSRELEGKLDRAANKVREMATRFLRGDYSVRVEGHASDVARFATELELQRRHVAELEAIRVEIKAPSQAKTNGPGPLRVRLGCELVHAQSVEHAAGIFKRWVALQWGPPAPNDGEILDEGDHVTHKLKAMSTPAGVAVTAEAVS